MLSSFSSTALQNKECSEIVWSLSSYLFNILESLLYATRITQKKTHSTNNYFFDLQNPASLTERGAHQDNLECNQIVFFI